MVDLEGIRWYAVKWECEKTLNIHEDMKGRKKQCKQL